MRSVFETALNILRQLISIRRSDTKYCYSHMDWMLIHPRLPLLEFRFLTDYLYPLILPRSTLLGGEWTGGENDLFPSTQINDPERGLNLESSPVLPSYNSTASPKPGGAFDFGRQ